MPKNDNFTGLFFGQSHNNQFEIPKKHSIPISRKSNFSNSPMMYGYQRSNTISKPKPVNNISIFEQDRSICSRQAISESKRNVGVAALAGWALGHKYANGDKKAAGISAFITSGSVAASEAFSYPKRVNDCVQNRQLERRVEKLEKIVNDKTKP